MPANVFANLLQRKVVRNSLNGGRWMPEVCAFSEMEFRGGSRIAGRCVSKEGAGRWGPEAKRWGHGRLVSSLNPCSKVGGRELRLGEPDCGEDPPGWPKRSPCAPPKGPCQPSGPPGYPPKQRPEKKPFCVECPPKKPCKTNKC
ncbi:hypothetical protein KM043_004722 [Ampulex compressa]|nr:hypothetical protein KM043_004722 [Ampulex compressa]